MKLSNRIILVLLTVACLYFTCTSVMAQSFSDEKYDETTSDITYNSHSGELNFDEINYSDEKAYYTIYNFDAKYYFSIPIAYKGKTASLGTDNIIVQFSPDIYLSIKGSDYYKSLTAEERYCTRDEFTLGSPALNETFNNIDYVKSFIEDKASLYSTKMALRAVSKESINDTLFWVFSYVTVKDEVSDGSDGEIRFLLNVNNGYIYMLMINSINGIINDYPEVMETLYSFNIGYRTGNNIYYYWIILGVLALAAAFIAYELFTKACLTVYDDAGNKVGVRASRRELKRIGVKRIKGETQLFDVAAVNKAVILDNMLVERNDSAEYHIQELKPVAVSTQKTALAGEVEQLVPKEQEIIEKTDAIENMQPSREQLLAKIMAQKDEINSISVFTDRTVRKIERSAQRPFNEKKELQSLDNRIVKINQAEELKKWAYENMPKEYTFKMKAAEIVEARNEITAVLSIAEWADPAGVIGNYSEAADLDTLLNEGRVVTHSKNRINKSESRVRKSEQRTEKKKSIREKETTKSIKNTPKEIFDNKSNNEKNIDINLVLDEILGRDHEVKPKETQKRTKQTTDNTSNFAKNKNSLRSKGKSASETESKKQTPEDILDSILDRNGKK